MSDHKRRLISSIVFILSSAIFAAVAWVVMRGATLRSIDQPVDVWLHMHDVHVLTPYMVAATNIARPLYVGTAALLIAVLLWYRRLRYWALVFVLAVPGGGVLNFIFKHIFSRHRPQLSDPILTLASYSFPSGHAMGATVFYGTLAVFAVARAKGALIRFLSVAIAILIIAFAAFSRVYLGLHYPSDVTASIAEGVAWTTLSLEAIRLFMQTCFYKQGIAR